MTDPLTLLCVVAHPDDETVLTGGLLAMLASRGAAVLIEERALNTDGGRAQFVDAIVGLATDVARRESVGQAMRGFAKPDAADAIVNRILELAA